MNYAVPRIRADRARDFAVELVRQLVVPTFVLDAQCRVVVWNKACERLTGMSATEVIGTREHWRAFYREPRPCLADLIIQGRIDDIGKHYAFHDDGESDIFGAHAENWCLMPLRDTDLYLAIDAGPIHDESGKLVAVVETLRDMSDRKRTEAALHLTAKRLESLANYDALTGLPNRVLLADRLHQALANAKRHGHLLAVCLLDLDGFKPINDQYGHEAGDHFLVEVAKRLTQALRGGDTVARLGGDEFVLLIADLGDLSQLEFVLARIFDFIAQPVQVGDFSLHVSASVGVTIYPLDESDPDTLLRHADQSMYQAKQLGKNRYQLFDTAAASDVRNRHQQLERIRRALQHGEFRLYYQPKVDMRTGLVVGMEALIRWQHPERGIVGPLEFLPLVEQTPLIIDIDEWVLHEALAQISQWTMAGRPMAVSVNIAARHFQHIDFVPRLRQILSGYPDVSPALLEIEILESAALEDIGTVRVIMGACQAMGVKFALDDFGTGYSSLSYLKQLPANTLKIDQSFVREIIDGPENLAIIEGVIGLAKVFEMGVIAEGVETAEHGLLLMRLGCDVAQGYGISRPMPAGEVIDWVADFKPDPSWGLSADRPGNRTDGAAAALGAAQAPPGAARDRCPRLDDLALLDR